MRLPNTAGGNNIGAPLTGRAHKQQNPLNIGTLGSGPNFDNFMSPRLPPTNRQNIRNSMAETGLPSLKMAGSKQNKRPAGSKGQEWPAGTTNPNAKFEKIEGF